MCIAHKYSVHHFRQLHCCWQRVCTAVASSCEHHLKRFYVGNWPMTLFVMVLRVSPSFLEARCGLQ